jgi:hypothetical protein
MWPTFEYKRAWRNARPIQIADATEYFHAGRLVNFYTLRIEGLHFHGATHHAGSSMIQCLQGLGGIGKQSEALLAVAVVHVRASRH